MQHLIVTHLEMFFLYFFFFLFNFPPFIPCFLMDFIYKRFCLVFSECAPFPFRHDSSHLYHDCFLTHDTLFTISSVLTPLVPSKKCSESQRKQRKLKPNFKLFRHPLLVLRFEFRSLFGMRKSSAEL